MGRFSPVARVNGEGERSTEQRHRLVLMAVHATVPPPSTVPLGDDMKLLCFSVVIFSELSVVYS